MSRGAPRPPTWLLGAGKGGVGTSTVTAALAVEAGAGGVRTLVVDGVPGLGNVHRLFGLLDGHPGAGSLSDRGVDPASLALSVAQGVRLIPCGGEFGAPGAGGEGQRGAAFGRMLNHLDGFDLVLIDGGASLDSLLPATALRPTGLLCVTVGEPVAMAGAHALIKFFGQRRPELPVYPLFNRAGEAEAETLFDVMATAGRRFLDRRVTYGGHLPRDAGLCRVSALAEGGEPGTRRCLRRLLRALLPPETGWAPGPDGAPRARPANLA